jgi:hypothetical protein
MKPPLIEILASIDALFTPMRWSRGSARACAAVAERRRAFVHNGVAFVAGGGEAARQTVHRELQELVGAGLIVINRTHGYQRGVTLTVRGDNVARSLTPTKRVDEAWLALELVATVATALECPGRFVVEHAVLGIEDSSNPKPFLDFEDLALPLLASGLLESASDAAGRVAYKVTRKGTDALAAGPPIPPADLPNYDSGLAAGFTDSYIAALAARDGWEPAAPSHVWVPLSAGRWSVSA